MSHRSTPRLHSGALWFLALSALMASCAESEPESVPIIAGLGDHHYDISSEVPETQQYFDQGLRLYYAFNHAEAIRAFEEAARHDPECAISTLNQSAGMGSQFLQSPWSWKIFM